MIKGRAWFSADDPICPGGVASYVKTNSLVYQDLIEANLLGVKWGFTELQQAWDVLAEYTKDTAHNAVSSWLCNFTGRELLQEDLQNLADTFTGWLPEFSQGYTFNKWTGGCGVWAFLHITDCKLYPDFERRYQITTKVMSGPASGLITHQQISRKFSYRMLHLLGLPYPPYGEEGIDPLNLGDLWMIAWLVPTPKGISVDNISASPTIKKHNVNIVERRKGKCTGPARIATGCTVLCPVGRKLCSCSTHTQDYPIANCKNVVTPHRGYIANEGWCSKCLREGRFLSKKDVYNDRGAGR